MAKESFWFKHDLNARSDRKMMSLLMKTGVQGVGIYWCIVEMLYEEGGYLMRSDCDRIAFELRTDCEAVSAVIESDLFNRDEEQFWSESVLRRLGKRQETSRKNTDAANKRWQEERKRKEDEEARQRQEQSQNDANAMRTHTERTANEVQPQCEPDANGMLIRREEKRREEIVTSTYNPQTEAQPTEKLLVREMIGVWKKVKPRYIVEESIDFPAMVQIALKIAKAKGWKQDELVSDKMEQAKKSWETIAGYAVEHSHYCKMDLNKIKNQWNGLIDSMDFDRKEKETKEAEKLKQTHSTATLIPKFSNSDLEKYLG
jgi:uncharacterized protein YdaU (DUF1376 family)